VTRSQRLTLIATILGSTVVFLDATVVNVALPAISEDLDTGLADQQWVVESYLLAMVSLLLVGGSLGDQYGRRRLFILGLIGFAATSVLCGFAPSPELLIAGRALQGIAGALLVPGSLAILAATFEGVERGKAIGTWTAWSGISTVVGPAGGGLLIVALSWRWIFWVNVPLILFTLYLVRDSVEESFDPDAPQGVDAAGILLSAAGLAGPVFALIEQPTYGWSDPLVWVPIAAGLACLAAFLVHESRTPRPLLPLSLFRVRNFAAANLATLTVYAGLMGGFFFIGLFLQQVAGYTALEAGLGTMPVSLVLFFLSPRFGAITARIGPRLPMALGPIVGGIGLLMMLRVEFDADYLGTVLPALLVFGLGLSATVAPLTTTVLNSVDEHHAGIASGVNNDVSRVAGLLAIAVLGAVISAHFGSTLDDRLAGARLDPGAQRALEDAKTRPLASAESRGLGSAELTALGPAIDDSAVSSFHLGVGLAGALMIAGGLVSAVGIRNPERPVVPERAPLAATAGDCGHPSGPDRAPRVPPPEPAEAPL
jgi:EmrB/QacA subfamily drug resistance transporter